MARGPVRLPREAPRRRRERRHAEAFPRRGPRHDPHLHVRRPDGLRRLRRPVPRDNGPGGEAALPTPALALAALGDVIVRPQPSATTNQVSPIVGQPGRPVLLLPGHGRAAPPVLRGDPVPRDCHAVPCARAAAPRAGSA